MKHLIVLLLLGLGGALAAPPLAEVETTWPGVKFQITNAQRVDPTHVLFTVRVQADRSLKTAFILVDRAEQEVPAHATEQEVDSGKYDSTPFTLVGGKLTDEATGKVYDASPTLPDQPFVGPNRAITSLTPGGSFQMGVYFTVPSPLPKNAEGVSPPQKVSIQFPKAAKPITGFVLPPDVLVPAP